MWVYPVLPSRAKNDMMRKSRINSTGVEKGMGNRRMKKRKKKMNWQKKLDKALTKVIKEQKKTIHAKEKIHRKAAKARKKK